MSILDHAERDGVKGLLTIAGGKLTTFALMARDTLRAVAPVIGKLGPRPRVFDAYEGPSSWPDGLAEAERLRLLGRHGPDCEALAAMDPTLHTSIGGAPVSWAELVHAARDEAVQHLDDLLLRRVRLGFLLPRGGLDHVARIRELVQPALGWDDARWDSERRAYEQVWSRAYSGR